MKFLRRLGCFSCLCNQIKAVINGGRCAGRGVSPLPAEAKPKRKRRSETLRFVTDPIARAPASALTCTSLLAPLPGLCGRAIRWKCSGLRARRLGGRSGQISWFPHSFPRTFRKISEKREKNAFFVNFSKSKAIQGQVR